MTYFTLADHQTLTSKNDAALQTVYDKFSELHNVLYRRLRDLNYDIHPHLQQSSVISSQSATCLNESNCLTLSYMRSQEQVQLVERLMGRDGINWHERGDVYRHPVIELRLTPEHFAVELVMSPYAWWDQQNFVGKLYVPRHRDAFRSILQRMEGEFRFGFWDGADLHDMHLTTQQLLRSKHLIDWTSTFADGQDWLRIGVWYDVEDPALAAGGIVNEIVTHMAGLYNLYTFTLWTSNNDFHPFYHRMNKGGEVRL
jgi:hypothetical protein